MTKEGNEMTQRRMRRSGGKYHEGKTGVVIANDEGGGREEAESGLVMANMKGQEKRMQLIKLAK